MVLKIRYKGTEISKDDVIIEWTDHWGKIKSGCIEDYASDYADDCIDEAASGEGW